jgi:hypothetical protein
MTFYLKSWTQEDPVERDFNAFSKAQSYAEDFDEAVNERVQQEVDKFFDGLVVDDVEAYMDSNDELIIELNCNGFKITPKALDKLVTLGVFLLQENDNLMAEEEDKRRQWD